MEAPEKIYVQLPSGKWIGRTWNETPIKEGDNPNWKNATNFEYTRTDVIVERAEKYLHEHLVEYWSQRVTDGSKFIEDFKKHMKGEKE